MIAKPSAQALLLEMQYDKQPLANGTGFLCKAPGGWMLITARHNLTGRDQSTGRPLSTQGAIPNGVAITYCLDTPPTKWQAFIEPLLDGERPKWHEHPTLGEKADFVALPISSFGSINICPIDLTIDKERELMISPAEPVSVVGFPFGIAAGNYPVWATGFLASEPDVDFNGLPIQLIDCRSRPGQSGSPVISYKAGGAQTMSNGKTHMGIGPQQRFIGIYSGRINNESDLGIVWKASAIKELIDSISPAPTVEPKV
jgi:hypothetical protein